MAPQGIGTIELAVDPEETFVQYQSAGMPLTYNGYSPEAIEAGYYHLVYIYVTFANSVTWPDGGTTPGVNYYIYPLVVDSLNRVYIYTPVPGSNAPPGFPVGVPGGNCFIQGTGTLDNAPGCFDPSFQANTANLVVGHSGYNNDAGHSLCTGSKDETFIFVAWGSVNPYGKTMTPSCPTPTFNQSFYGNFIYNPLCNTSGCTSFWAGQLGLAGGNDIIPNDRACIGDQVNWPRVALAYQPNDQSIIEGEALGSIGGSRITYRQYPFYCPPCDGGVCSSGGDAAGFAFPVEGEGGTPNTCVNQQSGAPCVCDAGISGCITPPFETDQILPQFAVNAGQTGLINQSPNEISLIWYDNTGRPITSTGVSGFGSVLGQSTRDGGWIVSSLQPSFAVIEPWVQEVDGKAPTTKVIGLSPESDASTFFGASHGSIGVYNQQWTSN